MKNKIKMYSWDEIQVVYKRFYECSWSVVYSIDGGMTWQSPEMDTGKWGSGLEPNVYWNMKFAFLELESVRRRGNIGNHKKSYYNYGLQTNN